MRPVPPLKLKSVLSMKKSKAIGIALLLLSSVSLADDAPAQKKLTLQDLIKSAAGLAPESTSVAGVRGLEETNGKVDTKARDFAALQKLDQVVVHEDELKKFIDEGKLR